MKRFTTYVLALVALLMITAACKREVDRIVLPSGMASLPFVDHKLMLDSFQMNPAIDMDGDGKLDPDLMVFMRPCDKDNIIVFGKDGTLSGSDGPLSCSTDQSDSSLVKPGTWSYNDQTNVIQISNGSLRNDLSEWKVIDASASSLKVEVSFKEDGNDYKAIMIWKAV